MTFEDLQEAYMAAWMAYMRRLRNELTPEERRRAFKVVMGGKAA
jgi:methanogenic corrinoid protein MtbC1